VAAYYIVAEALTNVVKHADADRASASVVERPGLMVVEVKDDGRGAADIGKGSGLRDLADRAEALGGTFEVDSSAPGHGCRPGSPPSRTALTIKDMVLRLTLCELLARARIPDGPGMSRTSCAHRSSAAARFASATRCGPATAM
jgi:hypothetical protein